MYLQKKFFIALTALTTTFTMDAEAQIPLLDPWHPSNPNSYNNMAGPRFILRNSSDKKKNSSTQQEEPCSPEARKASCDQMLNDMLKEGKDRDSLLKSWPFAQCSPTKFEDRNNHPVWILARHSAVQLKECYKQAGNPPYRSEEIKACIIKTDNQVSEESAMFGFGFLTLFVAGIATGMITDVLQERKKKRAKQIPSASGG